MSDYLTWLVSLDRKRLAVLLRHRPEALRGSPSGDLAGVAARLAQDHAIREALLAQPRPALQVLTALLLFGSPAPLTHGAAALECRSDGREHLRRVRGQLDRLEDYGLAWVDADEVAYVAPRVAEVLAVPADWGASARTLLEAFPKDALTPMLRAWGLPRQSTKAATVSVLADAFGDPERLTRQLERLPPDERATLGEIHDPTHHYADQRWFSQRLDALRAGAEAGVVFAIPAYSPYAGEVPAEVRLAIRGERLAFEPLPPALPTVDAGHEMVERESRAALELFNEASLAVLDHLRAQPAKWLQNGGVGAREVTRVAKGSKVEPAMVRLVLDLAYEAELVQPEGGVLRWSPLGRTWRELDAGPRVALLLERWLRIPRSPTQSHDAAGRSLAAADPRRRCPLCRDGRRCVVEEWLRHDGAVADAALAARVAWSRPLAHTSHREVVEELPDGDYGYRYRRAPQGAPAPPMLLSDDEPDLGTIADEARILGLVAHGASTPLLRALLADDRGSLVDLVGAVLPSAATTATFGSDLTAVVAGPPAGELSALLDACADRESRGGAATWRFSTGSIRRALDAGTTATDLIAKLTEVAVGDLPQPLAYLVADVGRRHGRLRVAPAVAVIRCEDPALLAEVTVDRKLRKLGLRLVAPTVAVSAAGEAETTAALRGAGYLPMPEASTVLDDSAESSLVPDGNVVELALRRPVRFDPYDTAPEPAAEPEEPATAAARLVGVAHAPGTSNADPRLVARIRNVNRRLSEAEVTTLAEAIRTGQPVRMRYRSASAALTDRVVSDLELSGPMLSGWCHLRGDDRLFRVSEILAVASP